MRLNQDELLTCQRVARQFPEFNDLVERWLADEVAQLLLSNDTNTRLLQGRARMLTDLREQLKQAMLMNP